MTDTDRSNYQSCLDGNLDRLLQLGEPTPRMPENLKAFIRSRLTEVGAKPESKNILSRKWAVWPLAATVMTALVLIVLWYGNSSKAVAWADVQERLEQVRTMTCMARIENSATAGNPITEMFKVYHQDPGLSRSELYVSDADIHIDEPRLKLISINRRKHDREELLRLFPGARRAEWETRIFRTNGRELHYAPAVDRAAVNWKLFNQITADKTRRIGERMINGVSAVGFEFDVPRQWYIDAFGKVRAQLWAGHDDGNVLFIEWNYRNALGQNVKTELSDIQWNAPLEANLFDLVVPDGWSIGRSETESAEYVNTGFVPGFILQIGPEGREPLVITGDVAGVVKGEQVTRPDTGIPSEVRITIQLKPEAVQRLRDYANANPDALIVADFNRQIKVVPSLTAADSSVLSFDLSVLDLSLAELEQRYFTTTIERNER